MDIVPMLEIGRFLLLLSAHNHADFPLWYIWLDCITDLETQADYFEDHTQEEDN